MNSNLFTLSLCLSAVLHAGFFAATGLSPQRPELAVVQAPTSMEIVFVDVPQATVPIQETPQKVEMKKIVSAEGMEPEAVPATRAVPEQPVPPFFEPVNRRAIVYPFASQGVVMEAEHLRQINQAPVYPEVAYRRGWEGTVELEVQVEKDGTVSKVVVTKSAGHTILDRAAVKAVEQWKFSSARMGGVTFRSSIIVPVEFRLTDI